MFNTALHLANLAPANQQGIHNANRYMVPALLLQANVWKVGGCGKYVTLLVVLCTPL